MLIVEKLLFSTVFFNDRVLAIHTFQFRDNVQHTMNEFLLKTIFLRRYVIKSSDKKHKKIIVNVIFFINFWFQMTLLDVTEK